MATLGLKEMGKFLWEGGREKGGPCWLSQFSFAKLADLFPISFKPNVAIAKFFWKMQKKTWYSILRVDARNAKISPIFHFDQGNNAMVRFFMYRHSSIYAINVGTQKKTWRQKPRKSRLLSSTKGEENKIEL